MDIFLGVWATENEIFSMALYLKTNIYVYSENTGWQTFDKTGSLINHVISKKEKSIYLNNTNSNHYDVVIDV